MAKSITISDLLGEKATVDVKTIHRDSSLLEAARDMTAHHISALIVTGQGENLAGIITERDLVRAIAENSAGMTALPVGEVMTCEVITCAPGEGIAEVLSVMNTRKIRHIPVLEGGSLRAIVSIRELTRAYELLQIQADTDALTGLSNRRHFIERLDGELERYRRYQRSISVAMIDIDHFKKVNDTYGHAAGDKVLADLAALLVRELRTIDCVGRLGGEEFALVFAETGVDKAKLVCERLLTTIRSSEIEAGDAVISITVSIGLLEAGADTQTSADILKSADALMYEAKARGRDCIQVQS